MAMVKASMAKAVVALRALLDRLNAELRTVETLLYLPVKEKLSPPRLEEIIGMMKRVSQLLPDIPDCSLHELTILAFVTSSYEENYEDILEWCGGYLEEKGLKVDGLGLVGGKIIPLPWLRDIVRLFDQSANRQVGAPCPFRELYERGVPVVSQEGEELEWGELWAGKGGPDPTFYDWIPSLVVGDVPDEVRVQAPILVTAWVHLLRLLLPIFIDGVEERIGWVSTVCAHVRTQGGGDSLDH